MKKVLVAGGAGFIGYHLCKRLLDEGCYVTCIDNLISGSMDNVKKLLSFERFSFIEADVVKPLRGLETSFSCYFHLASPASPNAKSKKSYVQNPIETLMVNSVGTHYLVEMAKKDNAIFIYASTSEVYGNPHVSPQPETYFGNVNSIGVRSVYDESKRFGEALCMAYFRKYGTDVRIVRIFNTYGEYMQRDDGRVISNFITQSLTGEPITIYGDGKQTRSFCYISDLVDGLMLVMKKGEEGEVINLGNPEDHTILEIAKKIKELTGSSSDLVFEDLPPDDPLMRKPDISKAKKLLDWEPKVGLSEGLIKTIEYFRTK